MGRKPSGLKMKQYSVRVNGVLLRKSFLLASEARKWQREQKIIQDEIRAGTRKFLMPTLLPAHAVDFLRSRKGMASYNHQEIWLGKYILSRAKFRDAYLHELSRENWKEIFGKTGSLILEEKLAPGTHNRIRAMVHTMYEHARREYDPPRATENPIRDIRPLKEPKKKLEVLGTKGEIVRYLRAAYEDWQPGWGIFAMIKLNTGLRQGNIMALRWEDVDLKARCLWIRLKYTRDGLKPGTKADENERSLGINGTLLKALTHAFEEQGRPAGSVFVARTTEGERMRDWHVRDCHERTIRRAGLPYISEHKLRHTYATHYLNAGGTIHDLKLNLFHSSITVTEKYAHALASEQTRRASVLQIAAPRKSK